MFYEFGRLRSPAFEGLIARKPLVVLPVGQVEEHGPHLPLNTDCVIGLRVAEEVARRLGETLPVVLMDLVPYGYSGKIMTRWPGTMQVPMDAVRDYVYEVCASLADMGVEKLAIFNSHGHHVALFELVARRLADEKGIGAVVLMPLSLASEKVNSICRGGPGSSCHAGELETSLMLHLEPELVDMSAAVDNPLRDMGLAAKGVFWSTWQRQKTESGLYGAPSVATASIGEAAFDAIVTDTVAFLRTYYAH